jgi:bifunctional DNA-binding transcriptional regulator/antitoxin component of YhaV-PrlF toxin-antitoxin module
MNKSWTATVDGEGLLTFPPDVLEELGWKVGDVLFWIDNRDGSWSLVKEDLTEFIVKGYNKV